MLSPIHQPTPISQILCRILIVLAVLTLFQALFLMFTYQYKSITHLISFIIYIFSVCKLSYFGCIINQCINITLIWFLLLEMAIKLKVGLYEIYLSSEGIYKMSSLIFSIVSLYFNFAAYKQFKQIAYEIFEIQNQSPNEMREPRDQRDNRGGFRERDWSDRYD